MNKILRAQSQAPDAKTAVTELKNQFNSQSASLLLFFCSAHYDLTAIAESFNLLFPDVAVVGCTTAGEIGPNGYIEHSISAVLFPQDEFSVVTGCLNKITELTESDSKQFVQSLLPQREHLSRLNNHRHAFAMQLIDGLSGKEEFISYSFQKNLGSIPLFGGSAADNMQFVQTHVFHHGAFHENSCVLVLFNTNRPFHLFKTQNFSGIGEPLVVTAADPVNRTIIELNGLPAADVYAQRIGKNISELNTHFFAAFPLVIKINGNEYIRSIQTMNSDGSLRLYCAIDEGVVLRVADSTNLINDLDQQFSKLKTALGEISLTLACDCSLRRMDIIDNQQLSAVADIFRQYRTSGFSSFGEQFGSLHVNQTCTGIAFGCGESVS